MDLSNASLGPALYGAEVLSRFSAERRTADLRWILDDSAYVLRFCDGRPAAYIAPNGAMSTDAGTVRKVLRAFAVAIEGVVQLASAEPMPALKIDLLGEVLVSVLHGLSEKATNEVIASRAKRWFRAGPRFDALSGALRSSRGPALARPPEASSLEALVAGTELAEKRAWLGLLALGGLIATAAPRSPARHVVSKDSKRIANPATESTAPLEGEASEKADLLRIPMPKDPDAVYAALELKKRLTAMFDKTHYEVLGLEAGASGQAINDAYLELAKTYHTDRYSSLDLEGYNEVAREVLRKITEAHRILSDKNERSNYDVYLDRKAKGLPTDVKLILEADNLFQRAKTLVGRGKGINAAPLMERAYELNHVDPEYKVYFAYTRYLAEGSESLREVRDILEKVLREDKKMAVAHDFLGRIFRAEDELKLAAQHLGEAVKLKPKNADAQRELRLVQRRVNKQKEQDSKKGGFLDKLLGR